MNSKAAAAGLEVVLAAAAAEESATFKHASLYYQVGDRVLLYEIRRQLPDRVHVFVESEGQTRETIAIGTTTYFRVPSGWQISIQVPLPSGPISLPDLLSNKFGNVQEAESVTAEEAHDAKRVRGRHRLVARIWPSQ